MTYLTVNLLLHAVALSAGSYDYATAFQETQQSGRPLVVLVGADWCPGCRQMKMTTIPELEKRGGLRKVAFAMVNTDHESQLANKLMRGSSIPQLVMFRRTESGWKRQQLTGAQSTSTVEAFLAAAAEVPAEQVSSR